MNLGGRLGILREEAMVSREELAAVMGLSYWTICKYETNERKPDAETLSKLADYFNTTVDFLLGRTNIRHTSTDLIDIIKESETTYQGKPLDPLRRKEIMNALENMAGAAHARGKFKADDKLIEILADALEEAKKLREERNKGGEDASE